MPDPTDPARSTPSATGPAAGEGTATTATATTASGTVVGVTPSGEPAADGPPLWRFTDPAYQPLAATLADVRAGIDELDDRIVELLARRAMYVKDAARFKRDLHQVSAPARQAQVYARVRELAQRHDLGFAGLPDVAEATYRTMVAAFIAQESRYFDTLAPVEPDPDQQGE